jgi:Ca-activated chloride channel family protein
VIELDGGRAVRLTVRDEQGAPLPGAFVEVAPGTVSPRATGAEGSVDLALPPGRYRLDVSLPGFLDRGMIVEVPSSGASVQVELALAFAEFAEQIAVVGEAVKLESSATSVAASDTRRRARPRRRPSPPPPAHATVVAEPAPPPSVIAPPAARQRIVRDLGAAATRDEAEDAPYPDMTFRDYGVHPFVPTSEDRLSTFGLDVDTGSWGLVQGYLRRGHLPPAAAVRVEEVINALRYGDPAPARGETFRITAEGAPTPFSPGSDHRLLRFGLRARSIDLRDRRPATLTFVVDVSGSMAEGGRLELVQEALGLLLDQLGDGDRVAVVAFSDEARVVLAPTGDPRAARRGIASLASQGSTNAEAGLALGYRLAWQEKRPGTANRVLLLTDGVANVGATEAESLLARAAGAAVDGIELTTVGVGMGNYDDVLLEQLANRGDGRYAYVDDVAAARRLFVEELAGTLETVAEEARVQVEFDPRVVASWRLLGYENRDLEDRRFRHDHTVDSGEIGAGHTVTAIYEVRLAGDPPPATALAHLTLRFRDPESGRFTETGRTLRVADLSPTWEEAPRSLRLAAVAAELAEQLRGSEHAAGADPAELARRARAIAADFPGDERAAELADLAARAARLAPRP